MFGAEVPGVAVDLPGQAREHGVQLAHVAGREAAHHLAHALEDVVRDVAMLVEEGLPLGRDVVDLLALGLHGADVALVLQKLQRRVDGTGRRRVPAAEPLLQRLHDRVAVAGLLLEEAQDDVLHLPRLEDLMAAAAVPPTPALRLARRPEARPEPRTTSPTHEVAKPIMPHQFLTRYNVRHDVRYVKG